MLTLAIIRENIESLISVLQKHMIGKIYDHFIEPVKGHPYFRIVIWYEHRQCCSNMIGYIRPTGDFIRGYGVSMINDCIPLFSNWCYELAEKNRQTNRTNLFKEELLYKTTYLDKIDTPFVF